MAIDHQLNTVFNSTGTVITTDDVVSALGVPRKQASRLLSRWCTSQRLARVGRGTYVIVPRSTADPAFNSTDPWLLVPALFGPAYIGGWSAAYHWHLTREACDPIVVLTTRSVQKGVTVRSGAQFRVQPIQKAHRFGLCEAQRSDGNVPVSDIHRTIVDLMKWPALGGGMQHVAACFSGYLNHPERDDDQLLASTRRLGNGVLFKRLGFLAERQPDTARLVEYCLAHKSQGDARLDPTLPCTRYIAKWRLRIPPQWITSTTRP